MEKPEKPIANLTEFGKFLATRQISFQDAAIALLITRSYASMLAMGRATPGLFLAVQIEDWSKGAIPCRLWVDEKRHAAGGR